MKKNIAEVFPTTVVGYGNQNYLKHNSKLLDLFETEKFTDINSNISHPKQTVDSHLEKREEYSEIYSWFRECLEDYRTSFTLDTEELKIVLSWANWSNQDTEHRSHVHPNSWISGIYYVTDSPSCTYFENPVMQRRTGIVVQSGSILDANIWKCPATTGELILFPSWMEHFTEPAEDQKKRITISFNVMPSGRTSKAGLIENYY